MKTAETDDPIGVATVLSLSRHSTLGSLKELKQFIIKHCPDKELRAKLEEVYSTPPLCFQQLVKGAFTGSAGMALRARR